MSEMTDCKDTEKKQNAIDEEALDNVAMGGVGGGSDHPYYKKNRDSK